MKKYKNDRKNIETEIPDIPMKKKRSRNWRSMHTAVWRKKHLSVSGKAARRQMRRRCCRSMWKFFWNWREKSGRHL